MKKLKKLLQVAYEKEAYERWLTLYPFMEIGLTNFISFEEYKNKILPKNKEDAENSKISEKKQKRNEAEMKELVKYYEKLKGKEEK